MNTYKKYANSTLEFIIQKVKVIRANVLIYTILISNNNL